MDLIIVDQNINYAQSLRKHFLKTLKFNNVLVFRTLRELLLNLIPQKGVLLYELNEVNENEIERITSLNNNLIVAALTDVVNLSKSSNLIEHGVTTIISKADKLDKISEQINLVIEGKRILSREMIEALKLKKNQNKISIHKLVSKLFY